MVDPRYRTWRPPLLELLLEHSIKHGDFLLASGERSDIYVDVRRTALLGEGALLIGHAFWELIGRHCPTARGIGGLSLGADPLVTATSIAAHMDAERPLAAILIRKQRKEHGTGRWLEMPATISPGDEVVVVDDTITTGESTLLAARRLRDADFIVQHAFCVVDREAGGREALESQDIALQSLFTLSGLVDAGERN